MTDTYRAPKAFVIGEEDEERPKTHRGPKISFEAEEPVEDLQLTAPLPLPSPRRIRWLSILVSALAALFSLWVGLTVTNLVEDFFTRSVLLGWIALGVAGVAAFAALAILVREIWGLMRLSRIEHIQHDAAHALNTNDKQAAGRAVTSLETLYHGRPDTLWGLKSLKEHQADILDPRDRIRLAERFLVTPRDAEAHRVIARAARRVTLITTVTPAASLDILFVAVQNLRMVRELATLYGGRPSALATFRLARMVVSHLAVTGGLALTDNILQHVVGRGVLGRLSSRFGEGAVNGILTSRIGLAACDVCRPIPQDASTKETVASLMKELVTLAEKSKAAD
jgi:putative membrane protein